MAGNSKPDARQRVDEILSAAVGARASDIHIEPTADGYEVRLRVDGLLRPVEQHDAGTGRSLVSRLMVMAHLLTYRLDVPQEGRVSFSVPGIPQALELRLAVMPTRHGLRAAVRLPADLVQPQTLADLGLPTHIVEALRHFAGGDSGMFLVTGPAGSGKTTTIYALLQHIVQSAPGLSVISLEDPVERDLPGVTQIEVTPFGELTYERALRSILRQDPQVLMLGEIRDAATASLAVQAALSGHRLICTLHAASPGGAITRLLEMGLAPYQVTSALFGVLAQRLLRRRDASGIGGYRGRIPVAEFVRLDDALRRSTLAHTDAETLQAIAAQQPGYVSLRDAAAAAIAAGETDEAEVRRVLGEVS